MISHTSIAKSTAAIASINDCLRRAYAMAV
jgi:hypothetical protein